MIDVPPEIHLRFDARLTKESIPKQFYHFYRRWLRFYFDFCGKYQHEASSRESLPPFLEKLIEKNQPDQLRKQAAHAISLLYDSCCGPVPTAPTPPPQNPRPPRSTPRPAANADWRSAYVGLKSEIAVLHYSSKTLRAYTTWLRHLQAYTKSKDIILLTPSDVKEFLTL